METELLGETGKEPPTFVFGGNPIKEENVEIMSKRYRVHRRKKEEKKEEEKDNEIRLIGIIRPRFSINTT